MSSRPRLLAMLVAVVVLLPVLVVANTASSVRSPTTGARPGVEAWVTDLTTDQRLAAQPPTPWRGGTGRGGATIVVDPTRRYQQMVGFGASMTDSSAYVLSTLPEATRRRVMRDLFSPSKSSPREGLGLSVLRQPMGASDFVVGRPYSYDDQPRGRTDPDLSGFSVRHDEAHILPRLREAYAMNPQLTFLASPWSAPGWMKTSGNLITGSLQERHARAYAQYFVEFIEAYRRAGIPTHYVTVQNEPLYEPTDYPGMRMWPDQAARFLARHLGPTLAEAGLDTQILGYDHNWDIPDYPEVLYADRRVARYVPGTAWHCYAGEVVAQSVVHNDYPHTSAFQTECSGGRWQGSRDEAFEETMGSVIGVPRHWGQSVVLWNLALDERNGPFLGGCDACRGIVRINDDATVTPELDYWALGHASRFVRPGAVRVGSSSLADPRSGDGLINVAFVNPDGSQVLVAHNGGRSARSFDVEVGEQHFSASLAPGAAATYRWMDTGAVAAKGDLGWVDLDYGPGPTGTPGGRLVASVSPEVVSALTAVRLGDRWLHYSLPYGSVLRPSAPATALSRKRWTLRPTGAVAVAEEPPANALDGDPRTRWSSGTGQTEGMSLIVDLGRPQTFTEIVLDARASLPDYLRRYVVDISDDGSTWTTIAAGPGRAGEMVIALPQTTTRYLRLSSATSAVSRWSVSELNLRNAPAPEPPAARAPGLVEASGRLADGTEVRGYRNAGETAAVVPWPVPGLGHAYVLLPTAAVTFAVRG